jgi:PAS domain S-box-containing protein
MMNSDKQVGLFLESLTDLKAINQYLLEDESIVAIIIFDSVEDLGQKLHQMNFDVMICDFARYPELCRATDFYIPLIILYEPDEEDRAFALTDPRINDLLPAHQLKRLPFLLKRKLSLSLDPIGHNNRQNPARSPIIDHESNTNENRFHEVVEGFNDPIVMLDDFLVIRYINKAFISQLGWHLSHILGTPVQDLLHLDEKNIIEKELVRCKKDSGSKRKFEHRIQKNNGDWEIAMTTANHLPDPFGMSTIFLHIQVITEKKKAEETLISQNIELQKINNELDRFVYSASHDLRSPILSAIGLLDICDRDFIPMIMNSTIFSKK